MVLHTPLAAVIIIIPAEVVVAHTEATVTVQTTVAWVEAATVPVTALQQEALEHIMVAAVAPAVILTQVPVEVDIKVLLLYDIEISKGKVWQRYRI